MNANQRKEVRQLQSEVDFPFVAEKAKAHGMQLEKRSIWLYQLRAGRCCWNIYPTTRRYTVRNAPSIDLPKDWGLREFVDSAIRADIPF